LKKEGNDDEEPEDKKQITTNLIILKIIAGIYITVTVAAFFTCVSKTGQRICFLSRCLLSTLVLPWTIDSSPEARQALQYANLANFALNLLQAQVFHVHPFDSIIAVFISFLGFGARIILNVAWLTDVGSPETLVLIMGLSFAVLTLVVLLPSMFLSAMSKSSQGKA